MSATRWPPGQPASSAAPRSFPGLPVHPRRPPRSRPSWLRSRLPRAKSRHLYGTSSTPKQFESRFSRGETGMAARPIWRGQIRLALVSIPVELYPATKSGASIQFHQVHEPSGKRIKYEKVVPGIGPVDRDEIVKGYEISKGHYVLLDPEEIESVKLESRKTLDLVEFVEVGEIEE